MRARVRTREMWRNVHGVKKLLCILMRFPCFQKIVVVFREKVGGFQTFWADFSFIRDLE